MPLLDRYELPIEPSGQWVDFKKSLTHGEARRIETARYAAFDTPSDGSFEQRTATAELVTEVVEVLCEVFVGGWHVLDYEGNPLPFGGWDQLPEPTHMAIALEAWERWQAWQKEALGPLGQRRGNAPPTGGSGSRQKPTRRNSKRA